MSLKYKSREEQFSIWKKRLKLAKDLHKERVLDWADKIFLEYAGDNKTNLDTNERYTQIAQVIISVEETIQPHLFYKNPTIFAKSKKPEWEKREPLIAAIVNHEYSDIKASGHNIELENELVILDARLLPFGCTKTTWEVEGGILKEKPDQSVLDKFKGVLTGRPPEFIETPVIEKEIGHVTERVNPLDVYLDYSASHITKQKFTFHRMRVSKDQLAKSRYEQDKIKDLEPNSVLVPEFKTKNRDEQEKLLNDPDFKGFTIYEIHDLENRQIHTMIEGVNDFIEFGSEYPIAEGSQFSYCWFIEKPNDPYPLPPIKFYRKRAHEFSYIYSQVAEQIDKFLPKIGFDVNRLSMPDRKKWEGGSLGTLVGFLGGPVGAWDVLQPKVQDDLFKYMAMIKELMNLEAGINDYEVAIPEERKATEARIIEQGTRARRFKPQKRVKGFIINQAHTIWQTLANNSTEEKFVKVLGENDALEWWVDPETGKQSWTKESIAGDYWFDIDVESLVPFDKQTRMQINNEALARLADPNLQQAVLREGNELIVSPILEKIASENWGIKDKSKIIKRLNFLEPEQEHDLWMQGQYPEINEREQKDPEFMMKHFKTHQAWINSPAFQSLPPELQNGAITHTESYLPLLAQLQGRQSPGIPVRNTPAPISGQVREENAIQV